MLIACLVVLCANMADGIHGQKVFALHLQPCNTTAYAVSQTAEIGFGEKERCILANFKSGGHPSIGRHCTAAMSHDAHRAGGHPPITTVERPKASMYSWCLYYVEKEKIEALAILNYSIHEKALLIYIGMHKVYRLIKSSTNILQNQHSTLIFQPVWL